MIKTIKKEEVVKKSNQPHNFTEGDVVTLVLNEGRYKVGGKLLKNDKISDKHHTETFFSGNEYMFVKRKGDKVLLVSFYGGRIQYPHCWVDISEIYHPFDGKVDKIDDNDSVEFTINVPLKLSYSYKEYKDLVEGRKTLPLYKTIKKEEGVGFYYEGEYDKISDIPKEYNWKNSWGGDGGYETSEKPSPITLFDQRKWINFFDKHNSNLDMRNIDLSEFVTDKFKSKVLHKIYDELDNVIQSSKNGYGKTNGGLKNRNN